MTRSAPRLTPQWLDALATGQVVLAPIDNGLELTAPMTSAEGVLGAVTVLTGDPELPHRLDEVRRVVATIAAQAAAAIERAWLIRRVEDKRRLEAIGEVATGVAHELRNPLFGISSAAQLLRFRAREDPMVEKNVGRILREVERLNRMVGSLLEFGRPAAPVLAPGDPDTVWDEVLESNRGLLESRSVVVQRTRAEPPARCAIDTEQLRQVFVNVLVNAIDAAPEASDLTLVSHALANGSWRCRLHNGGAADPAGGAGARLRALLLHPFRRHRHRPRALPAHHGRAPRHASRSTARRSRAPRPRSRCRAWPTRADAPPQHAVRPRRRRRHDHPRDAVRVLRAAR